jgi:hypothetical protein
MHLQFVSCGDAFGSGGQVKHLLPPHRARSADRLRRVTAAHDGMIVEL